MSSLFFWDCVLIPSHLYLATLVLSFPLNESKKTNEQITTNTPTSTPQQKENKDELSVWVA
jgi:hypothetical protein